MGEAIQFDLDGVACVIKVGDIVQEDTDAIVNSSDVTLNFSQGKVCRAIVQAAGASLKQECAQLAPVTDGFVISGAGNMRCRHIIHLVLPGAYSKWPDLLTRVFLKADSLGIKSLAIPALGTAAHQVSGAEVGTYIITAVRQFNSQTTRRNLSEIRIVVFQESMLEEFKKPFQDPHVLAPVNAVTETTGASIGVNDIAVQPEVTARCPGCCACFIQSCCGTWCCSMWVKLLILCRCSKCYA